MTILPQDKKVIWKLILVVTVVAVVVLLLKMYDSLNTQPTAIRPTHVKEWYQGGTLHKSTASQWKRAEYRNRLATTADWVSGTMRQKGYTPRSMDEVKEKAKELLICVEEAIDDPRITDQQMTEVVAICIILMGW